MTKKEEAAKCTKQKICEAFLYLLSMESFQKMTVRKISEQAGVNRTTFYKYFLDKFDLRDYYLKQVLDEFLAEKNYDFVLAKKEEIQKPEYSRYFQESEEFIKKHSRIYKILWNSEVGADIYEKMLEIQRSVLLEIMMTDPYFSEEKLSIVKLYAEILASNFMMTIRWWMENCDTVDFSVTSQIMKGNMEQGAFRTYRDLLEE